MCLLVINMQFMAVYLLPLSPSLVCIKQRNIAQEAMQASCWPATVAEWVWALSFLPCWLPSPPLYSIKSETPCSNNPWPTGSRHNGLKITHHLPWQQLPSPIPIAHPFKTIVLLQYACQNRWTEPKTTDMLCPMSKVEHPTLNSWCSFWFTGAQSVHIEDIFIVKCNK